MDDYCNWNCDRVHNSNLERGNEKMNKAEKMLDKLIDLLKMFCNNSCCDFCCFCDEGKCMFKEILGKPLGDFDPKDINKSQIWSSNEVK